MNTKLYSFLFISVFFLFVSCKKWLPENRIVGVWKLADAEKRRLFDSDNITTGYESGIFVFNENGTSTYTDTAVSLSGNWHMRKERGGYTDADGNWQADGKTVFIVRLYDFSSNTVIDWYFDRIDFRSGGDRLIAFMEGANYTYRYHFRKQ